MNTTVIGVLVTLLLFLGCAATQHADISSAQQDLVAMTQLPSISFMSGLKLNALFRLQNDGSVAEIKMLRSSGDSHWDAQAIDSMKQWRFTPLPRDAAPVDHWIRFVIVVQIEEPVIMSLGELVSPGPREADSLYLLLQKGAQFDSLARRVTQGSSAGTDWFFESVNIAKYPPHVREQITGLRVNSFTHPVRVGTNYVIYKRFHRDDSR